MDENKIIEDLNNFHKHKDIIKNNGINKQTLREIMNRRYSAEELEAFKWERSHQRTEARKNKYQYMYDNDEKYRAKKKKMALIRYYIKRQEHFVGLINKK